MPQPDFDSRINRFTGLFRELHEASELIGARLSAAGFGDIPADAAFLLAVTDLSRMPPGELLPRLGVTEQAASQLIGVLIARGYLERCGGPEDDGPGLAKTGRGRALTDWTLQSLQIARWAMFRLRRGDIVISTPSKSGTTWMQMICALLIFQTPDLPAPLQELSPWLEGNQEQGARLAAQQHRRFIKTHLPLSEIPADPRVTYITVARDPLDAAVSWHHHNEEIRSHQHQDDPGLPSASQQRAWLLKWIDGDGSAQAGRVLPSSGTTSLPGVLHHLSEAWGRRAEPNILLIHYEDLTADLDGQMRALAARLGITVPAPAWPALVQAATFQQMRSAASQLQPESALTANPAAFFRRGRSGAAGELLTSQDLARYHARAAQLAPPDLLAWLYRDHSPATPQPA